MSDLLSHQFFVSAMHTVTGFLEKQYADWRRLFSSMNISANKNKKGPEKKHFLQGPMYSRNRSMNVVKKSGNALQKLQYYNSTKRNKDNVMLFAKIVFMFSSHSTYSVSPVSQKRSTHSTAYSNLLYRKRLVGCAAIIVRVSIDVLW